MNKLQLWLMGKYCPSFYFKVPFYNDEKKYLVEAIIIHGYWGNKKTVVYEKVIVGYKNAYYAARWLAMIADFRYPNWLYSCGINYGIKEVNNV